MTSSFQDKDFTIYSPEEIIDCVKLIPFSQCLIDDIEINIYSNSKLTKPVLLYGPRKCGKTTFIRFLAQKYGYQYVYVSKYHIENMVKDKFEKAIENIGEENDKILLHFEFHIYSAKVLSNFKYQPITASSRFLMIYETIDPGQLNQLTYSRITFPIVSKDDRQIYLEHFLSGYELESELTFEKMAKSTPGYKIGEIEALCEMLVIKAKQNEPLMKGLITECAFMSLIKSDKIKHDFINTDNVNWNDIGGHDEVKIKLMNIMKDLLEENSCRNDGVILYGSPGCGKTMLAKALSNEFEFKFISMECTKILSKYQGDSEKNVSEIFAEARSSQPCILFIDEIDALCSQRDDRKHGSQNTIVNTFLVELDGIISNKNSKLLVIGATNIIESIDSAIKRSGRLGRHIEVKIPDCPQQRYDVLMASTKKGTDPKFGPCNLDINNFSIENIFNEISADKYTKEWNHSDLVSMVNEAKSHMKNDQNNDNPNCVTLKHMLLANKIKNLEKKNKNIISPEFNNFTKRIFVEDIDNKIRNYEFNEKIMTCLDLFITNNVSCITIGGRRYSGKSTLIDFAAKKYQFNLVKFNQEYFKNFNLEKFFHEINQFVQKNGQTFYHIDQRFLSHDMYSDILVAIDTVSLNSGVFVIFEIEFRKKAFIVIPEFTNDELELNLQNCLENKLIIEKCRMPKFISAISHWTYPHFSYLHKYLKGIPLITEEFLLECIDIPFF